jgi:hypothetical protein
VRARGDLYRRLSGEQRHERHRWQALAAQVRFALVTARWPRPREVADKGHNDGSKGEATEAAQQAGHVRYDHGRFLKLCCFARLVPVAQTASLPCNVGQRCCGCDLTFVQKFHVDVKGDF